ncbi:MAG TPA: hypothetical protein VGE27_08015 [Gemmatimonas sp.]|uniref:hypothetical protein n=1 Tax=Gemmatimonas sp. TaxID=1962908 RepID=UPI002EDB6D9B
MQRLLSLGGALVLFASGCGKPIEPNPFDGVFVLRTVGGSHVPAVTHVAFATEYWTLADTIVLRGDGSGEWKSRYSRHDLSTGLRDTTRTNSQFSYYLSDSMVRASDITCEPMCQRVPDERDFTVDGEWLTLGSGSSLHRYERITSSVTR